MDDERGMKSGCLFVCRKAVACPVIDIISYDNFGYTDASEGHYGGFDEGLQFIWNDIPNRENLRRNGDTSAAAHTPTMAGGLFTIDRAYFYQMGSYDQGMDIWGGENIEMSFRVSDSFISMLLLVTNLTKSSEVTQKQHWSQYFA